MERRFSRSNRVRSWEGSNICSDQAGKPLLSRQSVPFGSCEEVGRRIVSSVLNSNQFHIVRRKDFPFRVLHFHSKRLSGAFVQNLKTFLPAGEEITFSPLAQSNDDREQLSAFL